jgi:hypothetical protein
MFWLLAAAGTITPPEMKKEKPPQSAVSLKKIIDLI